MLFKLTHIDRNGHRRKARVTACNVTDAMDQIYREFGEPRVLSLVRMAVKPVLREVNSRNGITKAPAGARAC